MEPTSVIEPVSKGILPALKQAWAVRHKIINFWQRPNLSFDIKIQTIPFIGQDGKEHHYRYFCLLVSNETDIELNINPRKILINNESYQVIIQMEENFLKLNPKNNNFWKDCKSDIYRMYHDNWLDISEGRFTFQLKPYETKILPMKLLKAASHRITSVKKDSLLFFAKSKFSVTIEINRKICEYGLDRMYVYERYINYLAFSMEAE